MSGAKTVRLHADVYRELQRLAREWGMEFRSPNEVLRRALALPPPAPTVREAVSEVIAEVEAQSPEAHRALFGRGGAP